jgi:hypothetical protein
MKPILATWAATQWVVDVAKAPIDMVTCGQAEAAASEEVDKGMQSQRAIHRLLPSAAIAALASWSISPARAETPTQTCSRVGTDDTLRPISISLVPAVNTLFHTSVPPQMALDSTVFRCADGHVLACTTGANLPCGKANLSLTSTGAAEWCRDNPSAAFVPAVATGHYTIYQWRCRNGSPEIVRQMSAVDSRGFVAGYWKRLRQSP